MNVKEAAAYLSARNFRCSAGTVRALVRSSKLRCYRGPSARGPMQFPPEELDRFLRDELLGGGLKAEKRPDRPRLRPVVAAKAAPLAEDWSSELERELKA